jgi:hypothetical protein
MRCSFHVLSNDIEFSGERKRVRCNELLGGRAGDPGKHLLDRQVICRLWTHEEAQRVLR